MMVVAVAERMVKYTKPMREEQDAQEHSKCNGFRLVG